MTEERFGPVVVRPYRPGDEAGIVACHNHVFGEPGRGGRLQGLAHWRWKFASGPLPERQIVVAEHDHDGIVGTYAAIPYRVWIEDRVLRCAQGVDLVVRPEHRRLGPPPGLFVTLGKRYHDRYCGDDDTKAVFFFGWPIPAWKYGSKHLGYSVGRDWDFLFHDHGGAGFAPRAAPPGLEVRRVDRFGDDVDALFAALRGELQVCLVRDAAYLNWRYGECPDRAYRLYECRSRTSGTLRGVAVYTVGDLIRPHTAFLVDWLAPAADEDVTQALVANLEQQANRDRCQVLATVFSQVDPRFLAWQHLGFRVLGSPYFVAIVPYRHDVPFYRQRLYFTLGDSDLV
ncbi:MAG: GNAT family N-acetyltransferase [Planctomycetota bacterium]